LSFTTDFLSEVTQIVSQLDVAAIDRCVNKLAEVRARGGRLFFLGVGGSAANASHAVNDFRKIAGFEAYAPTDNVSELTARVNDESWESVFVSWLKGSRLTNKDGIVVFSVGGGDLEKNISPNLVRAVQFAKETGACVIIPIVNPTHVTPHSEAFQAVVWHLFVSHPSLKVGQTKWESAK
jgi:D-sedoheptulose 7-phosphate isomerase